ncbi:MAG: DUF2764 family protein [Candidatus Omnitrophica bacterium]|nr:DUF2764 family protein [Candidatus Omnitrophota bacterium]
MGRSYYYFAASLPMLDFNGKAPMSTDEFLNNCENLLQAADYKLVRAVLLNEDITTVNNACIRRWVDFNRAFLNEQVVVRAEKAGKDPLDYLRGGRAFEQKMSDVIQQAVKNPNLLEGTKLLDQFRWQFLDELAEGQYFNLEFILIYGLRLSIMEKYELYASARGGEIFKEYHNIHVPVLEKI